MSCKSDGINDAINESLVFSFHFQLTLFVHCLSRTPSTKKTQLANNYSALTLKFGHPAATRMTSLQRSQFSLPSQAPSEITQTKDLLHVDEVRSFACRADGVPSFLIENPYHQSLLAPAYEPMNFSCSQQTTLTSVSRENSFKARTPPALTQTGGVPSDSRKDSFAEKLRKCTQKVLNFQIDANSPTITCPAAHAGNTSNGSMTSGHTASNSSLKEAQEEDLASSELSQMMFEVNNEIPAKRSWCQTTSV